MPTVATEAETVVQGRLARVSVSLKSRHKQRRFRAPRYIDLFHA